MDAPFKLLSPPLCPVCRARTGPESPLCGECLRALNRSPVLRRDPPPGVFRVASCADHDGVPRAVLTAFKFRRLTGLAPVIAGYMADAAGSPVGERVLVPIPPARLRTWLRGFDPVLTLAGQVAERLELDLLQPLVRRGSRRQRGRGRAGRLADPPLIRPIEEAPGLLAGREALLVDDVMTTGATLAAGAAALRAAGASRVEALTFTRRL
ncbi:MAG: ComF family protein [Solirubrobacterales bacterium]|nr:ComF family protein [Solirubrobacterales bacterium]